MIQSFSGVVNQKNVDMVLSEFLNGFHEGGVGNIEVSALGILPSELHGVDEKQPCVGMLSKKIGQLIQKTGAFLIPRHCNPHSHGPEDVDSSKQTAS